MLYFCLESEFSQLIDVIILNTPVFYMKAIVAQITFNVSDEGKVEMIFSQGGRSSTGEKSED